ncbi:MAG: hypothetical protein A3I61_07885 [Acidobacteria bacterium RIFCSPLOWO2_02_FULL_68_18]|nr:MAG: hypothetical protein A3I61_07885 [Acidobacteria bacterium RIFCSPLOWO2_02_FULL_68_18]OFW51164.1 MAG: hypothetical protein A3G77_05985 [Acidobacteria bacterium RIFCSPLOWO2_12_FULL_68_19]
MIYTIDIGPNLFQLLQLYFVVRYLVPALVGGTLLVVAVFFLRYLLRQPDLDWRDLNMWKFAAVGAALGFVLACAVLAP